MKNGLLLGLDGVGKTLLLRQLAAHLSKNQKSVLEKLVALASNVSCATGITSTVSGGGALLADDLSESAHAGSQQVHRATQPTIGVEHTSLSVETKTCVVCEVGGQLLPMWKAYFASCDFWVFVVDLSNPAQIAGSTIEFFNILVNESMRKKPKLLLLNKMDAYLTLDDTLVRSYLQLDKLMSDPEGHLLHVIKVSAATGENVDSVIKWFSQRCSSGHHHTHSHASNPHHANAHQHHSTITTRSDSRIHPVEQS